MIFGYNAFGAPVLFFGFVMIAVSLGTAVYMYSKAKDYAAARRAHRRRKRRIYAEANRNPITLNRTKSRFESKVESRFGQSRFGQKSVLVGFCPDRQGFYYFFGLQ